jgi:hypothetical protein
MFLFALIASRWYTFYASWSLRPIHEVQIWCGRVRWNERYLCTGVPVWMSGRLTLGVYKNDTEYWWTFMRAPFSRDHSTNSTTTGVALWPPLLVCSGSAFATWRRAHKPGRTPGLCSNCGYDLRGLAHNAPCPECGPPSPG